MSGCTEKVVDAIFGLMNDYENIRARRNDDPLTAEYKHLLRADVTSVLYVVGALIVGCAVAGALTTVASNATVTIGHGRTGGPEAGLVIPRLFLDVALPVHSQA